MAVVAVNQQQLVRATQFIATFTGIAFEDDLLVCVDGQDGVSFGPNLALPFLTPRDAAGKERRLVISLDKVPAEVNGFSFQVHAAHSNNRAWTLTDATGAENYQNYETLIEAGKTAELLEFGRIGEQWFVSTKNEAIGELPLPPDHSMFPEHLRELALAARAVNPGTWRSVEVFVETNELVLPALGGELYREALVAAQGLAAAIKLEPLKVRYGSFGQLAVEPKDRIAEPHRQQLKELGAAAFTATAPTVATLRKTIEALPAGTTLVALMTTVGGFDVPDWLELLEQRECTLIVLVMRSVPLGILPDLGNSPRLRAVAAANLPEQNAKRILESLRSAR